MGVALRGHQIPDVVPIEDLLSLRGVLGPGESLRRIPTGIPENSIPARMLVKIRRHVINLGQRTEEQCEGTISLSAATPNRVREQVLQVSPGGGRPGSQGLKNRHTCSTLDSTQLLVVRIHRWGLKDPLPVTVHHTLIGARGPTRTMPYGRTGLGSWPGCAYTLTQARCVRGVNNRSSAASTFSPSTAPRPVTASHLPIHNDPSVFFA